MAHHVAKSWPWLFQPIKAGIKLHDMRKNDRPWAVGDTMLLQEFDPAGRGYTGEELLMEITYMTNNITPCAYSSHALDRDYSILSLKKVEKKT
jgi:hypothetical protein